MNENQNNDFNPEQVVQNVVSEETGFATSANVQPTPRVHQRGFTPQSGLAQTQQLGGLNVPSLLQRIGAPEPINDIIIPVGIRLDGMLKDLSIALHYELELAFSAKYHKEPEVTIDDLVNYHAFLTYNRVLQSVGKPNNDVRYHTEGWFTHPVVALFISQIGNVRDASLGLTFMPYVHTDDVVLRETEGAEITKNLLFKKSEETKSPMTFNEAKKVSDFLRRMDGLGVVTVPLEFKGPAIGELSFMSMTMVENEIRSQYDKQHPVFAVAAAMFGRMAVYEGTGIVPRVRYGSEMFYNTLINELASLN